MKFTSGLSILIIAFLVLVASSYAQTQAEQLKQMVEQLQKSPNDNALREKIIKLGAAMKPVPAIPEEANRAYVKGGVFKEEAKDVSDYNLAIASFREALRIAPWWDDAYFDLGVTLGLAGKFDEAIASLKLSMTAAPADSAEARDTQKRIYALEAKAELASKQAAEAEKAASVAKAKTDETLIVPGERIGRISLGTPMSQIERMLGKPEFTHQFSDGSGTYNYKSLSIVHDEQMNVYRVTALSSEYKTMAGVAVGERFENAQREWGPPLKQRNVVNHNQACFDRGTELITDLATGRIISIEVAYRCQRWAQ